MRALTILVFLVSSIAAAYAQSPTLASEQIFSGKYNKEKGVEVSISIRNGVYRRSITVNNNPALVKLIVDAFNKDREKENLSAFSQNIQGDEVYTRIEFSHNGEIIKIGLEQNDAKGEAYLFIRGPEKAFK